MKRWSSVAENGIYSNRTDPALPDTPINWNWFARLRSMIFRILHLLAPEGSSLDAVFGSYDDWRQMRQKTVAKQTAKTAMRRKKEDQ